MKWNPYSPGYFENPYPHLKACRMDAPVQEFKENAYLLFRYEDVLRCLTNKDFQVFSLSEYLGSKEDYIFKDVPNACPFLSRATRLWPMYLNGQAHRKVRRAMTKAFFSLDLDEVITESLAETIACFERKDTFDLTDLSGKFVYFFVKRALNLNDDGYEQIARFSNLLTRSQDLYIPKQVYQEVNHEVVSLQHIFKDSVFKDVIKAETEDLGLDDDQRYSIMLISLMSAFETSRDNLTLGLSEVLNNRSLITFLAAADGRALTRFIEEMLRFSTPLQFTVRINTDPFMIEDHHIPARSKLYLCLASANRDETVFEHPDVFLPEREHNPHLAFGAGVHKCLGASLARTELELCLQPMVDFLKDYHVQNVRWSKQILMHTPLSVMVQKRA